MRDHLSLLATASTEQCGAPACLLAFSLFYTTQMKDCFCHNLHTFLPLRPRALRKKMELSLLLPPCEFFNLFLAWKFSHTMHFMRCRSPEAKQWLEFIQCSVVNQSRSHPRFFRIARRTKLRVL